MKLRVNATDHEVDVEPDMPLLWVLRDELGITGPKYGCGKAWCGTYPRIRQAVKAAAANLRGA